MRRWDLVVASLALAVTACSESQDEVVPVHPEVAAVIEGNKAIDAEKAPTAASEFKPYESPDGLFRVNFPGTPDVTDVKLFMEAGRSKGESYGVASKLLIKHYFVQVGHYKEKRDPIPEIDSYVNRLMQRGVDTKMLESKDIAMKGRIGREVVISTNGDVIQRHRVFAGDMDFIQVVCSLPDTEAHAANGKAFIESFELLR